MPHIFDPHALLPLFSALAATLLASALVVRDSASLENRLVALLLAACALWSVFELGWNLTDDPSRALIWARASNIGPLLIAPLAVALIAALQPELGPKLRRWLPFAWLACAAAIAISLFSPAVMTGMTRTSWGWTPRLGPAAGAVYLAVAAFPLGAALTWRRLERTRHAETETRSLWVEIAVGIPVLMTALTNFVLPYYGVDVPRLGAACAVGWGGLTWWSVMGARHKSLAPREFALEIFESLPDGVVLLRIDGRVRAANGTMGALAGCDPAWLMGRPIDELLTQPPGDEGQERECELIADSGERTPVSVRTSTLRDDHSNTVGSVLVVRDLREVVSLRSRLLTSGRLAAVGQLAAGIAHEINNPIAYVRSNIRLLRQHWDEVRSELEKTPRGPLLESVLDDGEELIQETSEGVDRVAAIVRDVGGFGRAGATEMELANVHDLLETALRVAGAQLRGRIEVQRHYGDVPQIQARGRELMQVFLNLLLNAAQAIDGAGSIRLTTHSNDDSIVIGIEDDGPGIEPDQLERIFEPFFTTKPVGVGTGLGLAISQQIIETHRGEISATSRPGDGCRFEITLPVGALAADPQDDSNGGVGDESPAPPERES